MKTQMMRNLTLLLLLAFVLCSSVLSWKKEEFRTCNQTPFCKRARARKPGYSSLSAREIRIENGDLKANLIPTQNHENPEDQHASKPLILTLSVYQDGIVRLKIDEDPNLDPPKKRFEVPYVIVEEFDQTKLWLQTHSTEVDPSSSSSSSVVYLSDGYEAVLRHDPFEVYVREKGGKSVISLNSHGLFDFEQLKVKKQNGDENWEERFRGHTDTRPFGPQSISFDVSFYGADFVYGIPEHATSLALKPTRGPGVEESEPYRLFSLDVFEYLHESPFGLYGSIPFMISHGERTSGFFWLNAAEMQIDVLASGWDAESGISLPSSQSRVDTFWMSEAGVVDTFFFVGPGPKDVVRQYTGVTGRPAMPQLFATGYHQCRWNYRDEEDVEDVDSKFDEHDIPYDVLWLDIDHTIGRKYFTWDRALFPHPEEMQRKLFAKGRHMVAIVDAHIKRDDSYFVHKEATQKGYYVKDANGNDFEGWCWPGSSSYLDVLNPEIRSWFAEKFSIENYVGSTPSLYIWNDMNEPSVFNGPEITMPRDALHQGGVEHREVHNAYGYYFHMATSDGLLKRGDEKDRPFVLSRAFFAGSQRVGAVWTGDNTAEWEHLRVSVPMILTLGLTGISFSGADIGGFFGSPETKLKRNTELIRDAIHMRYTLLPYFYTLFREANTSGVPVARPLWMEFPSDKATFSNDEAFMVGNSLLVQGIYTEGSTTHKLEATEETVPAFQRSGTIIPRKDRFRRSSTQMVNDPYTLVIALNSSQKAEGEVYIDDGKSFAFTQGAYIHRRFVYADGKLTSLNVAPAALGGAQFSSECVIERIIVLGHSGVPKRALIEPEEKTAEIELGPLDLKLGLGSDFITIRKPNLPVAGDWTIKIV
ncbi:Neutral alpha-glucosidase AB [Morus notabilis]|uniref:Glucosidase II subunit alpha n=1 Tax=Morus notabilis TaxID=981085 RepID=W9R074_9ROSA|nr:Neutral alpha-glucosidase AB [Morus notabilis]